MQIFAIFLLAALVACGPQRADEQSPRAAMRADEQSPGAVMEAMSTPAIPWSVVFHDGSGNGFTFEARGEGGARFDYDPVKPEESSSGVYSGGEPLQGPLSAQQVEELWRRVLALEAEVAGGEVQRMKGTGAFRIKASGGERGFVVDRGEGLSGFLTFVEPFRGASGR